MVNMIEQLNEAVRYKIFCGNTDLDGSLLQAVAADSWIPYNEYTDVWYASKSSSSKHLVDQVEKIRPDVLYIIGIYSWHYNIVPLLFCKVNRKVLSIRGMLHTGALTQKRLKKQFFLQALKLSGITRKLIFHATDIEEASFAKNILGDHIRTMTASNFPRIIQPLKQKEKIPGSLKMVTIALISPMKNYLLVLQALEHNREQIEYNIYGPVKDEAYWLLCTEQAKRLPVNVTVNYHGDIKPAEVPGILAQHQVFIMPSKSENFAHAIVEALSAGLPVISSNGIPWKSLWDQQAGINAEEDVNDIGNRISFFANMKADAYNVWSDNARKYILDRIDLQSLKNDYAKIFLLEGLY